MMQTHSTLVIFSVTREMKDPPRLEKSLVNNQGQAEDKAARRACMRFWIEQLRGGLGKRILSFLQAGCWVEKVWSLWRPQLHFLDLQHENRKLSERVHFQRTLRFQAENKAKRSSPRLGLISGALSCQSICKYQACFCPLTEHCMDMVKVSFERRASFLINRKANE